MFNYLIFSICYFWLRKNVVQNFGSIKEWMMSEVIDKIGFEIMTIMNILLFIYRFSDHNLVFYSLYTICEMCVFFENMDCGDFI